MDAVELKILEKIKPTHEESRAILEFVDKLLEVSKKVASPFSAYPELVGSIAKDTFLRNGYDVDLFIVFKEKISREKLEEYGMLIGTSITEEMNGTYNIKYAEHPYVRAVINGIGVDIVPCYEITRGQKIISAVDRSPLHTRYIETHLVGSLKDQARLLKYFCKQIGIYGADAKHEGVSGYLCELLIVQYVSFEKALKAISGLKFHSYVDIEEITSEKEAKKKFREALIVIDPTDRNRNVASPLSPQSFLRFQVEAKRYLETNEFPILKNRTKNILIEKMKAERGTTFVGIKFRPPEMVPENLYPQLRRLEKRLAHYLEENDFRVLRHFSWTDEANEAVVLIEVERGTLSNYKKQAGPEIFSGEIENFLKKYGDNNYKPYIEKNQFFVCVQRRFQNIETAIKSFLEEHRSEMPDKIAELKIKVLKEKEVIEAVNENKALNAYLVDEIFSI